MHLCVSHVISSPFSADTVNKLNVLGSHEGRVHLLINSSLVCSFSLDREFGRLILLSCLPVCPPHRLRALFQDPSLPGEEGKVVSVCFQSPLLFTISDTGMVCILCAAVTVTTYTCIHAVIHPKSARAIISIRFT